MTKNMAYWKGKYADSESRSPFKQKMEKIPSKKAKHVPVSKSGKETVAQNAAEARGESYSWNPQQAKELTAKEDKKAHLKEGAKKAMKKR